MRLTGLPPANSSHVSHTGGLAAAQSAGRVVTDATARIASLYHEEKPAPRGAKPAELHDRDHAIGRVALANSAGIDQATLSRLKPLVEAPPERLATAFAAIEARGDVAPPERFALTKLPIASPIRGRKLAARASVASVLRLPLSVRRRGTARDFSRHGGLTHVRGCSFSIRTRPSAGVRFLCG